MPVRQAEHQEKIGCRHTSRQDDVAIQVFPDVDITLHDGVESGLVNAGSLHAHHGRRKQHLWAPEALASNCDHLQ